MSYESELAAQARRDYVANEEGFITTPGKFEGEKVFVPYFFALLGDGNYDGERETATAWVYEINIQPEDRTLFPEIPVDAKRIDLYCTDAGFVFGQTTTEVVDA